MESYNKIEHARYAAFLAPATSLIFTLALIPLLRKAAFPDPFGDLAVLAARVFALLAPVLWFAKAQKTDREITKPEPLPKKARIGAVLLAIPLMCASVALNSLVMEPFLGCEAIAKFAQIVPIPLDKLPFRLLTSVVILPFCEEAMFRGRVLGCLKAGDVKRPVLWSAIAFSLYHANLTQILYAFIAGMVIGQCAAVSKRPLLTAFLLHATHNLLMLLPLIEISIPLWTSILILLAAGLLLAACAFTGVLLLRGCKLRPVFVGSCSLPSGSVLYVFTAAMVLLINHLVL